MKLLNSAFKSLTAAAAEQCREQVVTTKVSKNKNKLDSGIEELMRDFQWNIPAAAGEPLKVKNDSTNHFDKVCL